MGYAYLLVLGLDFPQTLTMNAAFAGCKNPFPRDFKYLLLCLYIQF